MSGERSVSFGDDAEQYDRSRPSYPDAAIDVVCDGGTPRVLDVGCGTGIASRLLLARGCTVVGVEADERMASVARRHGVDVDVSPFETWPERGAPFDVVVSAQAWHWIDPVVGPQRAASVLRPGGRLALVWNGYVAVSLRDELEAVYRSFAPELLDTSIVLANTPSTRSRHTDEIDSSGLFGPVRQTDVPWVRTYSRDEWVDQLETHSDHRVLPADVRRRLLAAVGDAIDANGGSFVIEHSTRVLVAERR